MSTASKTVLLRLTPDEHVALTALSQETGQSLSRLVVSRVLGGAGSPASEVARARAVLQAALKALDGDVSPVSPMSPVESPEPVDEEVKEVVPTVVVPEVVFVEAPSPAEMHCTERKWVRAIGSIDAEGTDGYALHAPEGAPDFLRHRAEALLSPGTLVISCASKPPSKKKAGYSVLAYGWSGGGAIEWRLDDLLDWDWSKLTSLQRLRELLAEGPPQTLPVKPE
jgi:hypothetical protein